MKKNKPPTARPADHETEYPNGSYCPWPQGGGPADWINEFMSPGGRVTIGGVSPQELAGYVEVAIKCGHEITDVLLEGRVCNADVRRGRDDVARGRKLSVKGVEARRKYSEDDQERWRALARDMTPAMSKTAKAIHIAHASGLPDAAINTIRRVID